MNRLELTAIVEAAQKRGWVLGTMFATRYGRRYVLFGPRRVLVVCYDWGSGRRLASFLLDPETGAVLQARRRWPLVPVWALALWAFSLPARLLLWPLRFALTVCERFERWRSA